MSNQQDGGDASRDIKVRGGMEVKQAQVNHAEVLNVEELASRRTEEQGIIRTLQTQIREDV